LPAFERASLLAYRLVLILLLILAALFACASSIRRPASRAPWWWVLWVSGYITTHHSWARTSADDPFDTVRLRPFGVGPRTARQFKQQLLTTFGQQLDGLHVTDLVRVRFLRTVAVRGAGQLRLYQVSLSRHLPEVWAKTAYVVRDSHGQAAWFWLDSLWFIKEQRAAQQYLLSGVSRGRSRGYYLVYAWTKGGYFRAILNSLDTRTPTYPYGVPVYDVSLDCANYQPFQLHFSQSDLNGDGYLDVVFTGRRLFFCRGLEEGFSREDRSPIRTQLVRLVWLSHRANRTTTLRLQYK
jgi:hypothetical protein